MSELPPGEPIEVRLRSISLRPVERELLFQATARRFGRELVRALLALLSLVLVMLTVWLGFKGSQGDHWDSAKEWLQVVLPAETAILGSALGFYFGSRGDRDKSD